MVTVEYIDNGTLTTIKEGVGYDTEHDPNWVIVFDADRNELARIARHYVRSLSASAKTAEGAMV